MIRPYHYSFEEACGKLPVRKENSHKGTYGRLLLIAGTKNMAGAAYLAAKAAYRGGTGLVYIYTAEENRVILQQLIPEAVLYTYENDRPDVKRLEQMFASMSAIGIGPGIGQSECMRPVVELAMQTQLPVVADADALNVIASYKLMDQVHKKNLIVTPHPLEMARLCRRDVDTVTRDLIKTAVEFSEKHEVITVLKDHHTIVTDGTEVYENLTGNHAMATGGSGDVLTGIIGALLAQKADPFEAAKTGVYFHGRAGDEAAKMRGARSVMASDIAERVLYGL